MGYLKEICRTKSKIGQALQDEMNENDAWMHQDIRFWWDENQRHRLWMELDDCLMEVATDPQSELMDRNALMSCYNWHVQSYQDRTGPYQMPEYDEKEARRRHMQTFDSAGYKAEADLSYLGNKPFVLQLDMMHKELENPGFKVK